MTRKLIFTGSAAEQRIGFSRAVVEGDWVFVAGTAGFDYATGEIPNDAAEQTEQTLQTIKSTLKEGGASLEDVVRAQIFISRLEFWEQVVPVIKRHFGDIRPAMTALIAQLVDPRMKIEIEVTAIKKR
ncbi:MAG: RidA family protein [SAR324 cluster bacterium]|nr:RidA family protein [SAR324 cluster bacterium]